MLITINFGAYNKYRFRQPWISAVENWPSGQNPTLRWGKFQGDDDGGDAEIMAMPGDVIRWGQKGPSPKQTRSYWGIVKEDGSVDKCSMAQAHKTFKQSKDSKCDESIKEVQSETIQLAEYSNEQLLSEIRRRGLIP